MRRARYTPSNPLFGHASLMQSGFVQARMKNRTARGFSKLIVRSFDDGRDAGRTSSQREPIDLDASQYDVLRSNPGMDISTYEQMSVSANTTGWVNGSGHECDVAVANPSFDSAPYEAAPRAVGEESEPQANATRPATSPSLPAADSRAGASTPSTAARKASTGQDRSAPPAGAARAGSFTARQLDKLVTDENFRADLDAILGGMDSNQAKPSMAQGGASAPAARRQPAGRGEQFAQGRAQSRVPSAESAARELSDKPSEHAIFDKIAENMQFATAYELPSINLSRRFDSFDRQGPRWSPAARARAQSSPEETNAIAAAPSVETRAEPTPSASAGPSASPGANPSPTEESPAKPTTENGAAESAAANRQDVAPTTPNVQPPQLPPAPPQTLRPYSEAEMVATYGDPRDDADAWVAANVVPVQIPQLAGVPGPDGGAFDGSVAFHRLGMRSLSDLFAAWEMAGLMSKVLSFDGGHAVKSPHGDGVDAHAWAIAFDINARWNPAGEDPVPMAGEGSVAELVEIANRHGFVWGGHDPRRKAGLHFELGHRI